MNTNQKVITFLFLNYIESSVYTKGIRPLTMYLAITLFPFLMHVSRNIQLEYVLLTMYIVLIGLQITLLVDVQ